METEIKPTAPGAKTWAPVRRTPMGYLALYGHGGAVLGIVSTDHLQAIVNAAADLGVHAQLWTDGAR